jgi:hypothetical protein
MYSLLVDSGYLDFPRDVSEEAILQELQVHPEYIRDWRIYSEDKRTTGWYLMEAAAGRFGVGFVPSRRGEGIDPLMYPDEARACAAFIKLEIEYLKDAVKQAEPGSNHLSGR